MKAFPQFLEKVNKTSSHFICNGKIQNSSLRNTSSGKISRKTPHDQRAKKCGRYGNLRDSDKRSFLSGSERSVERFSKQLIPYWEAR